MKFNFFTPPGYVDRALLEYWAAKDPLPTHRELLLTLGVEESELEGMEKEEQLRVDNARSDVEEMAWPEPETVTKGVTTIRVSE